MLSGKRTSRAVLAGYGEMVYNTVMRRPLIVAILATIAAGCSRPAVVIATHLNNREFYYNRYVDECVVVKGPEECLAFQAAVNEYKASVVEAEAANARGGKLPLQLKALKDALRKVENARGR